VQFEGVYAGANLLLFKQLFPILSDFLKVFTAGFMKKNGNTHE